ncbi:Hypothetical predicted protein [Cloeon dipterum]|uniref:Chitin-binding type-2 domain-containing protein n=1 Tax=Cloeon dipterum TaxID=197152 RepID=A0A8S1DFK0_9INSE|nr:Hypothetical predicted protein [Cloeon dipterum]
MCWSAIPFFLFLTIVSGQLLIPGAPNEESVPFSIFPPPPCPNGQVYDERSEECRDIIADNGERSSSNVKHAEVTQNCAEGQVFNEESNGCEQQIASRPGMDVTDADVPTLALVVDTPIRGCPEGQVLSPHSNTCRPLIGSQGGEL